MSDGVVLDTHAFLTYVLRQPGSGAVTGLLEAADGGDAGLFMSVVNLGEVLYIVEKRLGLLRAEDTLALVEQLPIRLEEVSKGQALQAAHFKAQMPIAYADCFALALARSKGAVVLTGDPEFAKAEALVPIRWLEADERN